jgi:hypothetical protein
MKCTLKYTLEFAINCKEYRFCHGELTVFSTCTGNLILRNIKTIYDLKLNWVHITCRNYPFVTKLFLLG